MKYLLVIEGEQMEALHLNTPRDIAPWQDVVIPYPAIDQWMWADSGTHSNESREVYAGEPPTLEGVFRFHQLVDPPLFDLAKFENMEVPVSSPANHCFPSALPTWILTYPSRSLSSSTAQAANTKIMIFPIKSHYKPKSQPWATVCKQASHRNSFRYVSLLHTVCQGSCQGLDRLGASFLVYVKQSTSLETPTRQDNGTLEWSKSSTNAADWCIQCNLGQDTDLVLYWRGQESRSHLQPWEQADTGGSFPKPIRYRMLRHEVDRIKYLAARGANHFTCYSDPHECEASRWHQLAVINKLYFSCQVNCSPKLGFSKWHVAVIGKSRAFVVFGKALSDADHRIACIISLPKIWCLHHIHSSIVMEIL